MILIELTLTGKSFSVKVFYQGVTRPNGFGSFEFGTHGGTPIISTLSEPYGTPDWFPCKDSPADKADSSDVWITVADNLISSCQRNTYKVLLITAMELLPITGKAVTRLLNILFPSLLQIINSMIPIFIMV